MFDIRNIEWGNDSAENDPNLLNYFITPLNFERVSRFQKTFVIGRKGSGKTAIRKKLFNQFSSQKNHFVIEISPTNSIFRSLSNAQLMNESSSNDIIFQYAWLDNIMRKVLNLIGSKNANFLATGSFAAAREFAKKDGMVNLDFVETVSTLAKDIKLKASGGELGLNVENLVKQASSIDQYEFHLLQLAKDGTSITILVDDLDIGWDNSDRSNEILLGLLSASMYLKALHDKLNLIFFIRDDIYSILMKKTTHSDKYRDMYKIKWDEESFLNLLSERINKNFNNTNNNPNHQTFNLVFPEKVGSKYTLGWMIERTLDRPRELLQLARLYTENLQNNEPSDTVLKYVEEEYSNWKIEDLSTEFVNQYPNLDKIFVYWKKNYFRTKYKIEETELDARMQNILSDVDILDAWFIELKENNDFKGLAKILYDIGFLGDFIRGGDGGSQVNYFGDGSAPLLKEVQVHPCFRKAVGTVERIR